MSPCITRIRMSGTKTWLKAAALYLPKLALLAPPDYPFHLTRTAEALRDELGFLITVDPARQARAVAAQFLELLDRNADALMARYAWGDDLPATVRRMTNPYADSKQCGPGEEWVHVDKISHDLADTLIRTRLGVPNYYGEWIAMRSPLAAVYLSALADQVARANGIPVVTDQPGAYGVLNGWAIDTLARVLLSEDTATPGPDRPAGQIAATYAAIAIAAVVPAGLQDVPVDQVVAARQALTAEFDAFCAHLDSLSDLFTQLANVDDPAILTARLEVLLGRDLLRPAEELRRGLRRLGFQPARAVLGMKSLELPAALAAAASGAGLPIAAGQAGIAAAQFIASAVQARQTAEERRRSAAGYLLGLRAELNPENTVTGLRRLFRLAAAPPRS